MAQTSLSPPTSNTTSTHADAASAKPRDFFATTRWAVVLAAGTRSTPDADVALEELCRVYWYPLYAYVRRQGCSREDAEDLTQSFFARFLRKNYLEQLSQEKGRFRAYLLASLKHFLANEWDRTRRQKRGGGIPALSLDWQKADTRYAVEPPDTLTPDKVYDRAWAVTLLEQVVNRLREENASDEKSKQFEALKPLLMVGRGELPYAQAAVAAGINEGTARVAVHRLRHRYRQLLRDEIARTLLDPSQADEEVRALFAAFAG